MNDENTTERIARKTIKQVPWNSEWGTEVNSAIFYMVRILSSQSHREIDRFESIYRVPIYMLWERVKSGNVEDLKGIWYSHNKKQGR